MATRHLIVLLLLTYSGPVRAQEVKTVDLTQVHQRTELRHPPAPAPECTPQGSCVAAGYAGSTVSDGSPDRRDPHALGVYLVRVTPVDIDPAKPFEVEFRILNTGLAPIELPISPHLSDLQPGDESAKFSYLSVALVARLKVAQPGPPKQGSPSMEFVELYGTPDHPDTTLILKPGQWITVRANLKFHSYPPKTVNARLQESFWLRKNTFHPRPGGSFLETQNLYPNATPTPGIAVHLIFRKE